MTRRRLLEWLVAAAILLLLLAVLLVRPTARSTAPPLGPPGAARIALFRPVAGAPPDFTAGGFQVLSAPSPDGIRAAVLYPVEFEMPADLYLVSGPGRGTRLELTDSVRATLTPKNVGWLDERTLWVVLGYLYGTVSPGGDLFAVDATDGTGRLLWASPDSGRTQAVAADPGGAGGAIAVRLKVFDANLVTARDSTARVSPER
jgi:uncharacterized protein DUF4652